MTFFPSHQLALPYESCLVHLSACLPGHAHPLPALRPSLPSESCFAHVAASVVESAYLIQMGGDASSLSLSRQQFLSCSRLAESPYWGGRCAGGDVGEVSGRWVRVCGADSPCPCAVPAVTWAR